MRPTLAAWIFGTTACVIALLEAAAGALLSRRASGQTAIQRPLIVILWTLSLATLSWGIAYLRFAGGLSFERAWRGAFMVWFTIAGGFHLLLEIRWPNHPRNLRLALSAHGVAALVALLGWGTEIWLERVHSLVPFSFTPGWAFPGLVIASSLSLFLVAGLALLARRGLPEATRQRSTWLLSGISLTAFLSGTFQLFRLLVGIDPFLALLAGFFLVLTIPQTVSTRGLFETHVQWLHLATVMVWCAGLALAQGVLFETLHPPVPTVVAIPASLLGVLVVGYLVLPASRRTLDSLDALLMARRQGRRMLEAFLSRFGGTLDLDHIARETRDFLIREYGFAWVRCFVALEDGGLREASPIESDVPISLPNAQVLSAWVSTRVWLAEDPSPARHPPAAETPQTLLHRSGATLGLPLIRSNGVVGLVLTGPLASEGDLEERDRDLLQSLAAHLAVLVENAFQFQSATTDGLTGLLQRSYLMKRLHQEMDRQARHRRGLSLMMVDIDHFKAVNDQFGHAEGDRVLREVAHRIRSGLRSTDLAGRYGGEEFLLVLPDTPGDSPTRVAERLRQAVRNTPIGQAGRVTVSIGVASWQSHFSAETLIQQADLALYRAKRNGRDRVEVHGSSVTPLG